MIPCQELVKKEMKKSHQQPKVLLDPTVLSTRSIASQPRILSYVPTTILAIMDQTQDRGLLG
jgi:hypothetical protein